MCVLFLKQFSIFSLLPCSFDLVENYMYAYNRNDGSLFKFAHLRVNIKADELALTA